MTHRHRAITVIAGLTLAGFVPAAPAKLAVLDKSFGHRGAVELRPAHLAGQPAGITGLPSGKLLVAFTVFAKPHQEIGLVRLHPNGAVDQAFGKHGTVLTPLGSGISASGVAVDRRGRIVVSGTAFIGASTYVVLIRYRSGGKLDPTFGSHGINVASAPRIGRDARGLLIEPDGRIVIAGASDSGVMVARYTATTNTLDSTFDGDGFAGVPGDAGGCGVSDQGGASALTPGGGGAILADAICGGKFGTMPTAAVLRFHGSPTPDGGAFDTTFGSAGVATPPFLRPSFDEGLVRQPGGRLVQAVQIGYSGVGAIGLAGYTGTGMPDTGFGAGGSVTLSLGTPASDPVGLALAPTGKLLVAAYNGADDGTFALLRRTASGAPDPTFSHRGRLVVRIGGPGPGPMAMSLSGASGIAVQRDGRVLEIGTAHIRGKLMATVVRFGRPPAVSVPAVTIRRSTVALAYRDSQRSSTTVAVFLRTNGHRNRLVRQFPRTDASGANHLLFSGHSGPHRRLPRGRYLVALSPVADGLSGASVAVRFGVPR